MRRVICAIFAAMVFFLIPLNVRAAELGSGTEKIDVYAKYNRAVAEECGVPVENGTAQVTLGNGTTVTITQAPESAERLLVYPFPKSDADAWQWVQERLGNQAKALQPYEIYFLTGDGTRIPANGAIVTLSAGGGDLGVYSLSSAGSLTLLQSSASNGRLNFKTNGCDYYVLAKKMETEKPDNPDDSDHFGHHKPDYSNPRTGDTLGISVGLMTLSLVTFLLMAKQRKMK